MSSPYTLHLGDCVEVMRAMPDNSVDAIVTDPPYELGFMGKSWDASGIAYSVEMWREALRVLKPGGHLLAFSGSRTYHRMACAIEDAGFDIRDQIMWVYGSGFPKSLDVSKAIDKRGGNAGLTAEIGAAIKTARLARKMSAAECDRLFCGATTNWSWFEGRPTGQRAPTPETFALIVAAWPELASYADAVAEAEREVTGQETKARSTSGNSALPTVGGETVYQTWDITAPATDVARQWEGWGTALKPAHEPICVARKPLAGTVAANVLEFGTGALNIDGCRVDPTGESRERIGESTQDQRYTSAGSTNFAAKPGVRGGDPAGRWPANLIHDGSDEASALFPGDENNSAARFFYCAKASSRDRHEGLGEPGPQFQHGATPRDAENLPKRGNHHPTVKPTELMAYLCRLVTPPGGTVLDPFMGSGSTGKAAMREGFQFVGIDMSSEYLAIAKARIHAELMRVGPLVPQAVPVNSNMPAPQLDLFGSPA